VFSCDLCVGEGQEYHFAYGGELPPGAKNRAGAFAEVYVLRVHFFNWRYESALVSEITLELSTRAFV